MDLRLTAYVPAGSGAPAQARASLEPLNRCLPAPLFQDVMLLVNELVTNSCRHGGLPPSSDIRVGLTVRDRTIHAEITDRGSGFTPTATQTRTRGSPAAGGWGLYLVDKLSSRWGVEGKGPTTVWFEIDTAPAEAETIGRQTA